MKRTPFRRRYGQHFLVDTDAARRIVDLVQPGDEDLVLEVGPGRGALTVGLTERFGRVVAVEIDRDLAAKLSVLETAGLVIVPGDILDVDFASLLMSQGRRKLFVVGNLPYNISGPFLFKLREQATRVSMAILTLQREVALRIAAQPGSKAYGALTVMLHLWCCAKTVFNLSPESFQPQPRVQSVVIQLEFSDSPQLKLANEVMFEGLVRAAFGQRRKMLRNALGPWWTSLAVDTAVTLDEVAVQADIDLTLRAEALSPPQYADFSNALSEIATEARIGTAQQID